MKVVIVLNCGLYSKTGKWVLSQKMVQIQDIFKNGKPNIVLKTVKSFITKELLLYFYFNKSLKLGIFVLVMFNKILVIVFIIDFYSGYGLGSQNPSLSICAHSVL